MHVGLEAIGMMVFVPKPLVVDSGSGKTGIITPSKCLEATVLLALAAFQEERIMGQLG